MDSEQKEGLKGRKEKVDKESRRKQWKKDKDVTNGEGTGDDKISYRDIV